MYENKLLRQLQP